METYSSTPTSFNWTRKSVWPTYIPRRMRTFIYELFMRLIVVLPGMRLRATPSRMMTSFSKTLHACDWRERRKREPEIQRNICKWDRCPLPWPSRRRCCFSKAKYKVYLCGLSTLVVIMQEGLKDRIGFVSDFRGLLGLYQFAISSNTNQTQCSGFWEAHLNVCLNPDPARPEPCPNQHWNTSFSCDLLQ